MLRTATSLSRQRPPLRQFFTSVTWRNNGRLPGQSGDRDAANWPGESKGGEVGSSSSAVGSAFDSLVGKDREHQHLGLGHYHPSTGFEKGSDYSTSLEGGVDGSSHSSASTKEQPESADATSTNPASSSSSSECPSSSSTSSSESSPPPSESSSSSSNASPSSSSSSGFAPSGLPLDLPANYNLEEVKQRLKHWTEHAAVVMRGRADEFTAQTKTTFSQLGAHLNKVTGYEEIEALKRDVVAQEHRINDTRRAARQAKVLYEEAVIQRSKSQREVNDLLQRKSTWTDNDVSRFTTLVRQDHLFEQEEARAKAAVDESEDAVEREFSALMRLILARYHEEQVWSDKIRSASTYGQLAALGLNLLVFLLAIVLVEPWKRKRLAQTFERKVEELSEDYARLLEGAMHNIEEKLRGQEGMLVEMAREMAESAVAASGPPPPYESASPSTAGSVVGAVVGEVLDRSTSPEDVKVKIKVQEKEKVKHVWIPGVVDLPVSARTVELVAVGTGTFLLGLAASVLIGAR